MARPTLLFVAALGLLLYSVRVVRTPGDSVSEGARQASVIESGARADSAAGSPPVREPTGSSVGVAPALRPALNQADLVRAATLLQGGRDGALDALRKCSETSSDAFQHTVEVLNLQAKLLKYEHSLVQLGKGEYRLAASSKPVQRSRGREYLIAHAFAADGDVAHDLVFEFRLDDPRYSDLRVTLEDMRLVERRADLDQAIQFNAREEAERRELIERHLAATQRQQRLMDAIAKLPADAYAEREALSREADGLAGDLLPWHFVVSAGATRVVSRFEPNR